MAKAKKAPPDKVWWVTHPDHNIAIVSAPNWEQATVEAAKWWDVPWMNFEPERRQESLFGEVVAP